jgi:type IV pilus assembly protein PilC
MGAGDAARHARIDFMSAVIFDYKTRDVLGKVHEGTIEAENRDDAAARLRRDGMQVLELEEEGAGLELFPPRIRAGEIIYVTSQLAVMVDTGITLSVALESIAQQESNRSLKKVLTELKSQVESGEDFSAALARFPQHFDKTYISLIKASEHTGTLGQMLDTIAEYQRKQLETRQKVRAAMAYPAVMLVLAVGVTIFLLTYVMPKFQPLFQRKGIKLPLMTRFLMGASHVLIDYWYLWALAGIAATIAFFVARRTEEGQKFFHWLKINFPLLGPLNRKVILSRSVRTLGTMVAAGVSMLDCIKLAAEVAGNYYYEQVWLGVLDRITQGERIADSLRGNTLFPPTLVQMINSGEETAKLDAVLAKVSLYYDREVETSIKATTSLIEPLLIVVMGVVVGSIAMGLLLPIFSLSRPT